MKIEVKYGLYALGGFLALLLLFLGIRITLKTEDVALSAQTFQECLEQGNLIMESYPRQCKTQDGTVHVEDIDSPISIRGSRESQYPQTEVFKVGSELIDCDGVAPMKCLIVNDQLFYGKIEGFEHERGIEYELRVQKDLAFSGEVLPADATMYKYSLVEVISENARFQMAK